MYLKQGNSFPESTRDDLATLFEETIALVREVLGEKAFWLWRFRHNQWNWLARPTTSAYDAVMYVFSQNLHRAAELRRHAEDFRAAMPVFYQHHVQAFDARTTNMTNLRERDMLLGRLVESVVEHGRYVPSE
ncbi:hypothetical protein [Nocardioides houyundeii]|uniref:hypothetical protein n=1 Tax=Nocardioides houyundeii TaxID=2045452 RepID=UPI000C77B838|nr:hypothetical protein [Nocardioides houyundeii]